MNNKGKDRNNKNRYQVRKSEKANNNTGKATAADLQRLKEHFDKKFGRS